MNTSYDVIVVGAGPAGSMAAKTVAEAGADVLLLERHTHIGQPVRCAEGINASLFKESGIPKKDSFIEQEIKGARLYLYEDTHDVSSPQWTGYILDRKRFDPYLAQLAEKAGAEVHTGTKATGLQRVQKKWEVTIQSPEELRSITADIVVGADGFECSIGKWAGIAPRWKNTEYSTCYELVLDCPYLKENHLFHIALGQEFPNGYGWIFPKKHIANVGVAVTPGKQPKQALEFFINHYPGIAEVIGEEYQVIERRGGGIPTAGPRVLDHIVGDGILLVGDAAGMVEPFTGEGIASSILSGKAAGETITTCLNNNTWEKEHLRLYEQQWKQQPYIDSTLGESMEYMKEIYQEIQEYLTGKPLTKERKTEFMQALQSLT